MAKLTTKARKALTTSQFAEPGKRKYPIDTPNRGRNALSRVSEYGTAQEKATVRAKVHAKYPKIGESHGPVDDMPKGRGVMVAAHVRKAPKGYGGSRHQAQMGTLRVLGGKMC